MPQLYDAETDTYYVPVAGDILRALMSEPMRVQIHCEPGDGLVVSRITDMLQSAIETHQRVDGRIR